MAYTEVLLIKPVDGLGAEGEQVRVRAGYARNFLFLQGIALPVNRANTKYIESLKEARTVREARDLEVATTLAAKLAAVKLTFAVKTGEGGKMFGAISTAEIAAKLAEHGIELERKRIHLGQGPVKLLGKHVSTIRLHADVTVEQEFEVISENPIEEIKEVAEESDRPERDKKPRKQPRSDKSEKSDKKSKAKK
ncbi:MAG: 50S ribosomal protein L9 [Opitutia bacterium]|nr:50S ribosomal protein L9 [Opitutales bacterium]PHX69072.1 MAG: 50S ribosomal protein L9 [Opitutae bacterium]